MGAKLICIHIKRESFAALTIHIKEIQKCRNEKATREKRINVAFFGTFLKSKHVECFKDFTFFPIKQNLYFI